jgi:oligosaccharyltransferase complex subunit alpha (ribophorin I)
MRSFGLAATAAVSLLSTFCSAEANISEPLTSKIILPSEFKPPQVFRNVNLLRTINLEKAYPRVTVNVIIENVDSKAQDEYYLPFESESLSKVGALEVKDKKDADIGSFKIDLVEFDANRSVMKYLDGQ